MNTKRTHPSGILVALVALALLAPVSSADDTRDHPGYVDGSMLVEHTDEAGELVEVTLSKRMLKLFTRRASRRSDITLADLLADLDAVNAIVADVDERYLDVAKRDIDRIARRVEDDGWERFVRVRSGGSEEFAAYVHVDRHDEIDGLLVVGFTGGNEIIFVNLVGHVDMERVALIGKRFGMPGLDELPPASHMDEHRRKYGDDVIIRDREGRREGRRDAKTGEVM